MVVSLLAYVFIRVYCFIYRLLTHRHAVLCLRLQVVLQHGERLSERAGDGDVPQHGHGRVSGKNRTFAACVYGTYRIMSCRVADSSSLRSLGNYR